MEDVVLLKGYDTKGKPRWCMTRLAAYYRYKHTIKPLEDLLKCLDWLQIL